MGKEGHLASASEYESDLARNILSAAADEEKKESYKKLEEALKESEEARKKEAAEAKAQAAANEPPEPIGIAGYLGLAMLAILLIGACMNFGREGKKGKTNLNRKRGFFESFWKK